MPTWRNIINLKSGVIIFAAITICYCNYPAFAKDYYVAKQGNDANPGTVSSPWQTITKANTTLIAGDTIFIREGVYDEKISPVNSGKPDAYITYKAFPGESAVINRGRLLSNWQKLRPNIYWTDIPIVAAGIWEDTYEESGYYWSYWPQTKLSEVDGPGKYYIDRQTSRVYIRTKDGDSPNNHIIRTATDGGVEFALKEYIHIDGIKINYVHRGFKLRKCNYCILTNLTVQYAAYGIFLSEESNHNKVSKNNISFIGAWYWDEGDGIFIAGHHNIVEENDISFIGHNPIGIRGDHYSSYKNIVQNNRVHDSGSSGLAADLDANNNVWQNNISYRNTGAGIQIASSNNIIRNNSFYENGLGIAMYSTKGRAVQGNRIYTNTLYNNSYTNEAESEIWITEYSNGVCKNNVFKNNTVYNVSKKYLLSIEGRILRDNIFCRNTFYSSTKAEINVTGIGQKPLSYWEQKHPSLFQNNSKMIPGSLKFDVSNFQFSSGDSETSVNSYLTTTVESGTGKVIKVLDSGYFFDGFGIVDGDFIQVDGVEGDVKVLKVDYKNQHIEVDTNISWQKGSSLSLYHHAVAPAEPLPGSGLSSFPTKN